MRPWLAWSTLLFVAATARPAAADSVNGAKLKVELLIPKEGKAQSTDVADYVRPSDLDVERYFNRARCLCDRKEDKAQNFLVKLSVETQPNPALSTQTPIDLFAGDACASADMTTPRAERCSTLDHLDDLRTLTSGEVHNRIARSGALLAAGTTDGTPNECTTDSQAGLFVVANAETTTPEDITAATTTVAFDISPPTMSTNLTPTALERALRVSWPAADNVPDMKYVQVLCARTDSVPDGAPARAAVAARFDTVSAMCGGADPEPKVGTLADGSSPEGTLPTALKTLPVAFVCGEATGTASQVTVTGLENDIPYWVVLVAVDAAGNHDAVYVPRPIIPRVQTDFWEDANQENPGIQGGFCVSQVGRDGGVGVLLVVGASLFAVRRRRRRKLGRGTALLGLALGLGVLAPATARAQGWDPYWVDSTAATTDREEVSVWHLGLRFGPYHPSIDDSFTSDPGPYRRMFGPGYNIVPQLDLHRIWQLTGVQLGVGMSGGYYQKSGEVFESSASGTEVRVKDALNTFKMIPLSLTGTVRVTGLDDTWGLPVVPYLRGGLAYNVWWLRTPTGELAVSCDGCKDKALGASAGLVGAVGLSIRAERIDPSGAASMRNGGIEHAGFYAELETSWVDGFGNAKRLSLGDTTWYAGVDFEF